MINTSYNGRGPVHYRRWISRSRHIWRTHQRLVPPRPARARPGAHHGHRRSKVDAYLYLNRPGFSAGSCNGGPTPVGTWWPARAPDVRDSHRLAGAAPRHPVRLTGSCVALGASAAPWHLRPDASAVAVLAQANGGGSRAFGIRITGGP